MIYFLVGILFLYFFFCSILHESIFFSIFFLIGLFLITSFIFILLGFEFIGFLYLIVYVGAIAVLFLFMVMLFDKSEYLFFSSDMEKEHLKEERFALLFGAIGTSLLIGFFILILFNNLTFIAFTDFPFGDFLIKAPFSSKNTGIIFEPIFNLGTNLQRIGFLLYYYFYFSVIGAAVVLLVGMIGAIVLTQTYFRSDSYKKHQDIKKQLVRRRCA